MVTRAAIVIRPCEPGDLRELEWDGEYTHDRPIIDATYARTRDGSMEMLLADLGGAVIGQIWVDLARERAAAKLWALRVKPPWRGRGIGRRLLAAAERVAGRRGFAEVEIEVEPGNPDARRLYEAVGYELARFDEASGFFVLRKRVASAG
jgi:ribosomal protein S18 acetylase RimI-like enzyme